MIGLIIFLLIGILLGFLIFPKLNVLERSVFSLALSTGFLGIVSVTLHLFNTFNQTSFSISAICSIIVFSAIISTKRKKLDYYKTEYDKSIYFVLAFSLFGTLWRYFCFKYFALSSFALNNAYEYSFKFIGKTVPNLGFYTGMAQDKSGYIGVVAGDKILEWMHINPQIALFLATFLFLGFIFLLFKEYRTDKRLAYLGVALLAIGPIELFYQNTSIYGHALSYIILLPLFLFFKSKNLKIFWVCLLLSVIMMTTYYTSSVTVALCCLGFLLALSLKSFSLNLFKNKKFWGFLIIFLIIICNILLLSNMTKYTMGRASDFSDEKIVQNRIRSAGPINIDTPTNPKNIEWSQQESTLYQDPIFLGLSAIRWQALFFFLCGALFLLRLSVKQKISQEEIDLLLCLIPVAIISYGFFHVNLPARIFDYFAFSGLLVLGLPKKYFKTIFIILLGFILLTGAYVAKDKKIFFELSAKEYSGAEDIKNEVEGKIFSDQVFANQLISQGFYNVTGADDKSQLVRDLFYQNNEPIFINAINSLHENGVDYIALTKRMKEKYVLMVNYPQKAVLSFSLFEKNLEKIYDNKDVSVYKIPAIND